MKVQQFDFLKEDKICW